MDLSVKQEGKSPPLTWDQSVTVFMDIFFLLASIMLNFMHLSSLGRVTGPW